MITLSDLKKNYIFGFLVKNCIALMGCYQQFLGFTLNSWRFTKRHHMKHFSKKKISGLVGINENIGSNQSKEQRKFYKMVYSVFLANSIWRRKDAKTISQCIFLKYFLNKAAKILLFTCKNVMHTLRNDRASLADHFHAKLYGF